MERTLYKANPLFVGLTRPAMYAGVTLTFLAINVGISLIVFVLSSSFVAWFVVIGLGHAMGYTCCQRDPRIFELLIGWLQARGASRNIGFWGCNSYEPF